MEEGNKLVTTTYLEKPSCHPNTSLHAQEETAYGKRIRPSLPVPTPRLGHAHGLLASASFPGCNLVVCSSGLAPRL